MLLGQWEGKLQTGYAMGLNFVFVPFQSWWRAFKKYQPKKVNIMQGANEISIEEV